MSLTRKTGRSYVLPPAYPIGVEQAFFRILNRFRIKAARYAWDVYRTALKATYDAPMDLFTSAAESLKQYVSSLVNDVLNELDVLLRDLGKKHTKTWTRNVQKALGVDISALLGNVDLEEMLQVSRESSWRTFKNYSEDFTKRVEQLGLKYALGGESVKQLELELRKAFNISKKRAKLIARDQVAKANSHYNQYRQEQAGISKYRWSDSDDERVRPTHAANDRKLFSWSRPPAVTGHPGNDIQCRCSAIAVLD